MLNRYRIYWLPSVPGGERCSDVIGLNIIDAFEREHYIASMHDHIETFELSNENQDELYYELYLKISDVIFELEQMGYILLCNVHNTFKSIASTIGRKDYHIIYDDQKNKFSIELARMDGMEDIYLAYILGEKIDILNKLIINIDFNRRILEYNDIIKSGNFYGE